MWSLPIPDLVGQISQRHKMDLNHGHYVLSTHNTHKTKYAAVEPARALRVARTARATPARRRVACRASVDGSSPLAA